MGCSTCSNNTGGVPKGCKSNGNCGSGCGKLDVHDWLANIDLPHGQKPFDVVEVRFKNDRKAFFRNQNSLQLSAGEIVTVQATSGYDVGVVTLTGELVKLQMSKKKIRLDNYDLQLINHKSNQEEIEKWHESRERETETMKRGREIADELKLKMKICDVEFQADGKKVTVYYTSDDRVDFRELIKKYAEEFKIRVEMRQIGARQEAGKLGGIGSCGRELCCSTWLTDFRTVNTSAARYQQLSLNPQKLAGQCGKLKCCLNYELDMYVDEMKKFPNPNIELKTEEGQARHQKNDIFTGVAWYIVNTKMGNKFYPLEIKQAEKIIELNKKGQIPKSLDKFTLKIEEKEAEINYENVVGQDEVNRFDDKFKKKKNNRRNKVGNKGANKSDKTVQNITPKAISESKSPNSNTGNKPNSRNKKRKKPNIQKRDNNNNTGEKTN